MENHHCLWVGQLYMAIFHSYVELPEGMHNGPRISTMMGTQSTSTRRGQAGSRDEKSTVGQGGKEAALQSCVLFLLLTYGSLGNT